MRAKHKRDQRQGQRSQRNCTCERCQSGRQHHNVKREPFWEKV